MSQVSSRDQWLFGENGLTDVSFDKNSIIQTYIKKFLIRTQKMFKYNNLPKTIPARDLELLLQCNGCATIAKVNGELYALKGSLGGTPNPYYMPTVSVIANPALKFSATLKIDEDCIVIPSDGLYQGLLPLIKHASNLLAECDISFKFTAVNIRIPAIIEATNDTSKKEAEKFLEQVENGEKLGIITGEQFLDRINVYDYGNTENNVQHLIELKQYIFGTFCQEIGIQSAFNMKREAINEAEASLSTDILYPLVDDMLKQRKDGLEKVNKMFGTNISVELDSVWSQLRKQQDLAFAIQENEANQDEHSNEKQEVQNEEPNK